jgi:hypothetical protein
VSLCWDFSLIDFASFCLYLDTVISGECRCLVVNKQADVLHFLSYVEHDESDVVLPPCSSPDRQRFVPSVDRGLRLSGRLLL